MKFYLGMTLASAITLLPISAIRADVNTPKVEEQAVSREETRTGHNDASGKVAEPKSAEQNNKIRAEKSPPAKEEKKSTGYFRPASSYSTQPESDPPHYERTLSKTS